MVKSSQYVELANDLEINKAITYLRQKDFNKVSVRNSGTCRSQCGQMVILIDWHLIKSVIAWNLKSTLIIAINLCSPDHTYFILLIQAVMKK